MLNEKSYDYLKNQLLYLGFGEEIAGPLKEKMGQGLQEFTLAHYRKFGEDETHSVLHFSKSEKDVTFFNRYDVTLKQPAKQDLTQTFFVAKEFNYTLQERYNMLDGRYVYREQPKMMQVEEGGVTKIAPSGETYFAWRGLDFRQSDQHGNFLPKTMFWNHEKELARFPVAELADEYDRMRLVTSLEKGNRAHVTLVRDGQEVKASVAANPRMMRLDFYDSNGRAMAVSPAEKQKLNRAVKLDQGAHQQKQATKKESARTELTEDNKNSKAQQKRRGLHL